MSGLRERKKKATWGLLSSTALRLAAQRGPDGVTVEEISEAAGVSARTFFNYFPTKEDAILGTDPDRVARTIARVAERPADEAPLEVLRVTLAGLAVEQVEDADSWALRMRLVREHPSLMPRYLATLAELERTLSVALAERLGVHPDEDPYPALAAAAAVGVARASFRRWHAHGHREALRDLLDDAFDHLARGLPLPDRLTPAPA